MLSTLPIQMYSAATSDWTNFTATLVAPPNAAQITIRQVVGSLNPTLYIDDVQVQPIEDLVITVNGGFEWDCDADGTPDAWSAKPGATRTSDAAHSGRYALRHQANDNRTYTVFSDPIVPIVAGQSYSFIGWVKIPATVDSFSFELQVRWRDSSGNVLSTVPVQTYTAATNGWTSFTGMLVAPSNATQATIRQVVTSLNATIYVDDLVFGP